MTDESEPAERPGDGSAGTMASWVEVALRRSATMEIALVGVAETGEERARHSGADLAAAVAQIAGWLRSQGARPGERVAIFSRNAPEFVMGQFATWLTGCAQTLLNTRLTDDEIAFMIDDSRPLALLVGPGDESRALTVLSHCEHRPAVLGLATTSATANVATMNDLPRVAWSSGVLDELAEPSVEDGHPASVAYTGGTTGKPKAVVLSNRSLLRALEVMALEFRLGEGPFLHAGPLVHGTQCCVVPALFHRVPQVIMEAFRPATFLDLVTRYGAEETLLAPSMLYMVMDALPKWEAAHGEFTGKLRKVLYGGSSMNPERAKEAIGRFGSIFHQFYGQGECPMVITTLAPDDHAGKRLTSAGRATWLCDVRLVDDDGKAVPTGSWGEIVVRSPLVMEGYLNRPEETAAAFAGGVLHTGDVAYRDEDGYLYIVDRKKDMIVTGGYNVFSAEVEQVIARAPGVREVCVVGMPDPTWGERIHCLVVPAEDTDLSRLELEQHAREHLPAFKVPKSWSVVNEIPVTAIGKYDKKAVRHTLAETPLGGTHHSL